jgi:hypothetical protein
VKPAHGVSGRYRDRLLGKMLVREYYVRPGAYLPGPGPRAYPGRSGRGVPVIAEFWAGGLPRGHVAGGIRVAGAAFAIARAG